MKQKIAFVLLLFLFIPLLNVGYANQKIDMCATLTIKVPGGGIVPYYGMFIAKQLKDIGIKVEVKIDEWIVFIGTLVVTHDFDLVIEGTPGGRGDPVPLTPFIPLGNDIAGLTDNLPYMELLNELYKLSRYKTDIWQRREQVFLMQEIIMDKIVPFLPLFSPKFYSSTWSNLNGFNETWPLSDVLPYMEYSGLHEGQHNIKEFRFYASADWRELNPLLQNDASSSYISSLIMEPIMQTSPGGQPLTTGLIDSWEMINDSFFKFHMREGVYWNPSYDVTERTPESDPLDPLTTPLMIGLKGEVSDGINQPVTAKDAVFTYLAWANPITSEDPDLYDWIKAIWVDPDDEYSFYIVIDGDPDTPELDPYALFWESLPVRILPEFFLNSTDTTVTYSAGGVKTVGIYDGILHTPAWKSFSVSAFGCGKYMLDYHIKNSVTVLQKSPYWEQNFGIGAIDGTKQDLNIDTIIVPVIYDYNNAFDAFIKGKLDFINLGCYSNLEQKQLEADSRFKVYTTPGYYLEFLFFNLRRPFIGGENNYIFLTEPGKTDYTKGVAIRKAICYAIDREEINRVIYDGEFLISDSPIYHVQAFWYYHDIIKYRHNIDAALEWLSAAGVFVKSTSCSDFQFDFFIEMFLLTVVVFKITKRKLKPLC